MLCLLLNQLQVKKLDPQQHSCVCEKFRYGGYGRSEPVNPSAVKVYSHKSHLAWRALQHTTWQHQGVLGSVPGLWHILLLCYCNGQLSVCQVSSLESRSFPTDAWVKMQHA